MSNAASLPRAVIFDIDNTLIDNPTAHIEAMANVTERLTGTRRTVEPRHHGLTDYQILTTCLEEGGLDPEAIRQNVSEYFAEMAAAYRVRVPEAPPQVLAGATELVTTLDQHGFVLGVVSGNLPAIAWDKLERIGVRQYFRDGAFGDRPLERHQLVTEVLAKLGVTPDHAVVLGDTPRDVAAGRTAGTKTFGVATGWSSVKQLTEAGADAAEDDLSNTRHVVTVIEALV